MKKERLTTSDEQRERTLIAEQIERAAVTSTSEKPEDSNALAVEEGLKRSEGAEKVVLSLSAKPSTSAPSPSLETPSASGIGGFKMNPLKASSANPLKRANVFKSSPLASSSGSSGTSGGDKSKKRTMSAAESLIYEEQERKRRKMERDGGIWGIVDFIYTGL
jgi:DNA/RNA-binding protein KIN17